MQQSGGPEHGRKKFAKRQLEPFEGKYHTRSIDSIKKEVISSKKIKSIEVVYVDPEGGKQYKIRKKVFSPAGLLISDSTCALKNVYTVKNGKEEYIGRQYFDYKSGGSRAFLYDAQGQLIAEVGLQNEHYSHSKDSVVTNLFKKTLTYDGNGRLIEEIRYDNSPNSDSIVMMLTAVGNGTLSPEALKMRTAGMRHSGGRTLEYDEKGNKTRETEFDFKDDKKQKSGEKIYKYDAAGRMTDIKDFNSQGKLEYHSIYTYDENGRKKSYEDLVSLHPKIQQRRFYAYDAKGNMIRETCLAFKTGKTARIVSYKYDSQNRLAEEKDTVLLPENTGGFVEYCRKIYKYDQGGSLTECSEYLGFDKKEPDEKIIFKDMLPLEKTERDYDAVKKISRNKVIKYLYEYYP